jgi:hypothetical protein
MTTIKYFSNSPVDVESEVELEALRRIQSRHKIMKEREMKSWSTLVFNGNQLVKSWLLSVRDTLHRLYPDFDRKAFNQLIRDEMARKAGIKNANFYAYDKCQVKGHQYQVLWDNGECLRCGRMDM